MYLGAAYATAVALAQKLQASSRGPAIETKRQNGAQQTSLALAASLPAACGFPPRWRCGERRTSTSVENDRAF